VMTQWLIILPEKLFKYPDVATLYFLLYVEVADAHW
jgi:hypothetical protein